MSDVGPPDATDAADLADTADMAAASDQGGETDLGIDAGCVPITCEAECGEVDDGCGDVLDCGLCGDPTTIEIISGDFGVLLGEHFGLNAAVYDEAGLRISGVEIEWASSNASVSVQANGRAIADALGTAEISATVVGFPAVSGSVAITVESPQFFDIGVGARHSCALTGTPPNGRAYCWGDGSSGAVGRQELAYPRLTRVETNALYAEVDSGEVHSCAITADRTEVHCWGMNDNLQLGSSRLRSRDPIVADLPAGPTFSGLRTGLYHTCVVGDGTQLWCWGLNDNHQVTTESDDPQVLPHAQQTFGDVSLVGLGYWASCGMSSLDGVACWGQDEFGQLGDGDPDSSGTRVATATPLAVRSLDAYDATFCAITQDDALFCWGLNDQGQIDPDLVNPQNEPTRLLGGAAVRDVAVGWKHMCLLPVGDPSAIRCVGANQQVLAGRTVDGVLGTLGDVTQFTFTAGSPTEIDAGAWHTCFIDGGEIYCWGKNDGGELGDGTTTDSATPVRVRIGSSPP